MSKPTVFRGVEYPSRKAMAEAHGIPGVSLAGRLRRGWSMEEALELVHRDNRGRVGHTVEFAGTTYASLAAASEEHGQDRETVACRLGRGWSLAQALGAEPRLVGEKHQPTVAESNAIRRRERLEGARHCQTCREYKALEDFSGKWARCRLCVSEYNRQRLYGATLSEVAELQGSRECAACGTTERLHIDHDHVTGGIRGILCHHCNTALGLLKDDPKRIEALARYLEKPPLS